MKTQGKRSMSGLRPLKSNVIGKTSITHCICGTLCHTTESDLVPLVFQSVRRGAAGTCRPSRAVKTFRGIIFLFSKIFHFRFIRKKETYLPVQRFDGSINSYTQCILWTIFYHVVTSLKWNWEVCKRKYCLNGRKFSRTFFGQKTGTFRIGTKKWLSTELNHTLKNWRKIKHLRGNKNSDLPE